MQNKNKIIGFVIIIALILLIAWFQIDKKQVEAPQDIPQTENQTSDGTKTNTSQTGTKAPTQSVKTTSSKIIPAATIVYSDEGYQTSEFTPSIVTIRQGQTVLFINSTKEKMWIASDPHPSHSGYPGFDQKTSVGPGGTYQFTFQEIGKWGFHNHLNPVRGGRIIVKQAE
jgi:plastocyanin